MDFEANLNASVSLIGCKGLGFGSFNLFIFWVKFFANVIFKVSMSTLFHGKLDSEQRTVSQYRAVLISHPSLVLPFFNA